MADQINSVFDQQAVLDQISAISGKLSDLDAQLKTMSQNGIDLKVNNPESINDLNDAAKQYANTIKSLSGIQKDYSDNTNQLTVLVDQYGSALRKNAEYVQKSNDAALLTSTSLGKIKQAMIDLIAQGQINSDMYAKLSDRAKSLSDAQVIVKNTLNAETTARKESVQMQKLADAQTQKNIKSKQDEIEIDQKLAESQKNAYMSIYNSLSGVRAEMVRLELAGESTGEMYAFLTERALGFVAAQDKVRLSTTPGQSPVTAGSDDAAKSYKDQYYAQGLQNAPISTSGASGEETPEQQLENLRKRISAQVDLAAATALGTTATNENSAANVKNEESIDKVNAQIRSLEDRLIGLNALMKSGGGGAIGAQAIADTEKKIAALKAENGIIAEQNSLIQITAAQERQLIAAQSREIAQVNAATIAAEKNTYAYKAMEAAKRMAYRLPGQLIELALFTLAFEAIGKLTEAWKADAKAAKEYAKAMKDIDDKTASSFISEKANASELVAIATSTSTAMNLRLEAVKELQTTYPEYFKNMTAEKILAGDITKAYNDLTDALYAKVMMQANESKAQKSADTKADLEDKLKDAYKERESLKKELAQVQQRMKADYGQIKQGSENEGIVNESKTALDQNEAQIKKIAAQILAADADVNKYLDKSKKYAVDAAGVLVVPDKKSQHVKKENNKNLDEQLRAIKEFREQKDAESKLEYEQSAKDYDDEYKLLDEKINHEKKAYADSKALLDDYFKHHSDFADEYKAKLGELNKDEFALLAASAATKRQVDDEIAAENKKGEKANEEYLNKLYQSQQKIAEIQSDLQSRLVIGQITRNRAHLPDRKTQYDQANAVRSIDEDKVRVDNERTNTAKDRLDTANFAVQSDNVTGPTSAKKRDEDIAKQKTAQDEYNKWLAQSAQDSATATGDADALKTQKVLDNIAKEKQAREEVANLAVNLAQETASAIIAITNNQFAVEEQNLQIKAREQQVQNQQQIEAINATSGYAITKDNLLAKQAASNAAQQNAIQNQQNQLALKQAIFQKEAAEAGIIMNTALAITKTLPMLADPVTAPFAAAEIAIITGIGAVQYAAAASTPLPQFEFGGTTTTALFRAGESGPEKMTTPAGQTFIAPRDAVYSAPIGTHIDTAAETAQWAMKYIGVMPRYIEKESNTAAMTDGRIVDTLKDLIDVSARKQPIIVNVKSGDGKGFVYRVNGRR